MAFWWLGCAAAHAGQEATAPLPPAVAKALGTVAETCREAGGKPITGEAVKRADLNGDGRQDYILDVAAIQCQGAPGVYGDREKGIQVFAGDGAGGAREAFSDSVFGMKVEGAGSAAKLWLTVTGRQCGKEPAADFASESFCERALAWNATTGKFDYAPVSSVRMIQ